jgi:hypothetical protein
LFDGADGGVEFDSEFAGVAEFTFASGSAVFAAGVSAGASAAGSATLFKTEEPPLIAGIVIKRAESMNTIAAPMVIFERTVAVPRGP